MIISIVIGLREFLENCTQCIQIVLIDDIFEQLFLPKKHAYADEQNLSTQYFFINMQLLT